MQQRLNVLTLGVDDVGRARSCDEALGWKIGLWDRAWIEALPS
jgi:hypothetical protein